MLSNTSLFQFSWIFLPLLIFTAVSTGEEFRDEEQKNEEAPFYRDLSQPELYSAEELQFHLSLANIHATQYNYANALREYDYILQLDPGNLEAESGKAQVYIDYARYDAKNQRPAISSGWFAKALALDPSRRMELLLEYAAQLTESGRAADAVPLYREYLSYSPSKADQEQAQAGLEHALSDIKQQEEKKLKQDEGHKLKIQSEQELKDLQEKKEKDKAQAASKKAYDEAIGLEKKFEIFKAKKAYWQSVQLAPDNKDYVQAYAWFLSKFGFKEEAVEYLYRTLELTEGTREIYRTIGWGLKSLGLLKESLAFFAALYPLECAYSMHDAYELIGLLQRREIATRFQELEEARSLAGNTFEETKQLFEAYAYFDAIDKAWPLLQIIKRTHPESYYHPYLFANTLFRAREFPGAAIEYIQLILKRPESSFLYFSLGQAYEEMEMMCEAAWAYEVALGLEEHPVVQRALARIYAMTGSEIEAMALSESINSEESGFLTKELSEAEVSFWSGDYATAANSYSSVLDDYNYNQEALWGLWRSNLHWGGRKYRRLAYRRWPTVHFTEPYQELLVPYMIPSGVGTDFNVFSNRDQFCVFYAGLRGSEYLFENSRLSVNYYYTRYQQAHYNVINRNSILFRFDKYFTEKFETHCWVIGNFYDHIQKIIHNLPTVNATTIPSEAPPDTIPVADATAQPSIKTPTFYKASCNYYLDAVMRPKENIAFTLAYQYYDIIDTEPPFGNPIYNYSYQVGAVALNIRTHDYSASLAWSLGERFYIYGKVLYGRYSDGNNKQMRSFRMNYTFRGLPRFDISYDYFFLNFTNKATVYPQYILTNSAYYDPKNFEVHVLTLRAQQDLSENVLVGAEAGFQYFPKGPCFGGFGHAFTRVKMGDRFSADFDLRYYWQNKSIVRTGFTGKYYAQTASCTLNYFF